MHEQIFVSIAIINIEYENHHDYIDNFIPLVAGVLFEFESDLVSIEELQHNIENRFKLHIPLGALRSILGRTSKKGYIKHVQGVYQINRKKLSEFNFNKLEQDALRQFNSLIQKFNNYIQNEFNEKWDQENLENNILIYVQNNTIPLMHSAVNGIPTDITIDDITSKELYITGKFISHLEKNDSIGFESLIAYVKGFMLANVLYFPKITKTQLGKNLKNVDFYFDTPFLIRALGLTTEIYEKAYNELILMLRRLKADLLVFDHTLEETRNVIIHLSQLIKNPSDNLIQRDAESISYLISENIKSSDLVRKAEKLEDDLLLMGIRIKSTPKVKTSTTIDENCFREILDKTIGYRYKNTRDRDIRSICSINHLRQGKKPYSLEKSKAIFITDNLRLTKISKRFFENHEGYRPNHIPHIFPAHIITTLVWLKTPRTNPDLPQKMVQATCYAALNPSDKLWRSYLEEVERLRKKEDISEDDYHILVLSNYSQNALMEITHGSEDVLTEASVHEILKIAVANYVSEIKKEADFKEKRANIYENRDKQLATTIGKSLKVIVTGAITIIFIALIYTIAIDLLNSINNVGLFVIKLLVSIYFIVDGYFDLFVNSWLKRLDITIANKILSKLTPKELVDNQ